MYTTKSSAMKKAAIFIFMGLLISMISLLACGATTAPYRAWPHVRTDFALLDNYGEWIEVTPFGWCWRPFVVAEWHPYCYGHWSWSNVGWTWMSYEPYGWLVYHYGNWQYDPLQGWTWIPGHEWSPARVSWVRFGIYIGWAPLPPPRIVLAAPWEVRGNRVNVWNVVEVKNFTHEEVGRVIVASPPRPRAEIESRVVYKAPEAKVIARETHQRIEPIKIHSEVVRMGSHNYRQFTPPPRERERIEQHRAQVEREVIRPRAPQSEPKAHEKTEEHRERKERHEGHEH